MFFTVEEATTTLRRFWKPILAICIFGALVITVISLALRHQVTQDEQKQKPTHSVCLSEQCIQAANRILSAMNARADPCQDFNEFACGRFMKNDDYDDNWYYFSYPMKDIIKKRGKRILEEQISFSDVPSIVKAKKFYKSCMDEEALEALGVKPLLSLLNSLDGWPVLSQDSRNRNYSGLDHYQWVEKVKTEAIMADQPALGLSISDLAVGLNSLSVQNYYRYMQQTAVLLGTWKTKAEEDMKEALKLEIRLAKELSYVLDDSCLAKLKFPSWLYHVQQTQSYANDDLREEDPEMARCLQDKYWENVLEILDQDLLVTANYLGWRMAESKLKFLNSAARSIRQKYLKEATLPRWQICLDETGINTRNAASFRVPLSAAFEKRYLIPKQKIVIMSNYLRQSSLRLASDSDWLDPNTREQMVKKLNNMYYNIGYPVFGKAELKAYDEGLGEMEEEHYFGNVLQLQKWFSNVSIDYKVISREERGKKDSMLYSSDVNAYYFWKGNYFVIPAGYLQGPYFNLAAPMYLNFGASGAAMGHKIMHGFDNYGRKYDYEGIFTNWWSANAEMEFNKRAQCLINQYYGYKSDQVDMHLSGTLTLTENIADNGGIKLAYMAYELWTLENGEEATLPGLNFTTRQLFWIQHAQSRCARYGNEELRKFISNDGHSPGPFRIQGPLSNFPQFAKDFECPLGTPMNPKKKCTVW